MRRTYRHLLFTWVLIGLFGWACQPSRPKNEWSAGQQLDTLFDQYYRDRMRLFPLEATENGVNSYNDKLYADFTDSYRDTLRAFYTDYQKRLEAIVWDSLTPEQQSNALVLRWELDLGKQGTLVPFNLMPLDQFWGLHLKMGQYASGQGIQPFKTVSDYENWLKRVAAFSTWADSAIVYFRRGMQQGVVLPKVLVVKMLPQLEAMTTAIPDSHVYFGPIRLMPDSFPADERARLTDAYRKAIVETVVPTHRRLADFLRNEYLPVARTTDGIGVLPEGDSMYRYTVSLWTTTELTPDSIYQIGLAEVKFIRDEMERIKSEVGFKGSLSEFFDYLYKAPKFFPFRTNEEVLNAFRSIQSRIQPRLGEMFSVYPKTPFEIRQTEAFREASGSAEYISSPDGVKPGVFYVPIPDARKFNTAGMESLFLHEAIPGHHFQTSLQLENKSLPEFRKHIWTYGPYVEGWALYSETLGKDLGLYQDPYQYFTALGEQMLRAVRLVMDVGIHHKGMTRDEAIAYMMANYPTTRDYAVSETERYMAIPGQALGYRIGVIRIKAMRDKAAQVLGKSFSLSAFHDKFLSLGAMPIGLVEQEMDRWVSCRQ